MKIWFHGRGGLGLEGKGHKRGDGDGDGDADCILGLGELVHYLMRLR